jgi:chromosome segregation ATPase
MAVPNKPQLIVSYTDNTTKNIDLSSLIDINDIQSKLNLPQTDINDIINKLIQSQEWQDLNGRVNKAVADIQSLQGLLPRLDNLENDLNQHKLENVNDLKKINDEIDKLKREHANLLARLDALTNGNVPSAVGTIDAQINDRFLRLEQRVDTLENRRVVEDINFQNKYLKYKNKYINLKTKMI